MRPRARLIGLIGDELISDEPVALVELVKNSYDADATKVEVRFEGKDPVKPDRIVVTDDGIGMDLDTVLEAWFEPGTVMKRKCEQSPGGRLYQGAKGIGRFATARLAEFLQLESKTENASRGACVLLEWGQFDDDSYLDEISIDYEESHLRNMKPGTRLTLDCLRKTWEEKDYNEVHARLSRLISPFQDVTDFDIHLEIPAFPQLSGRIEPPELILQPKYLLRGKLDKQGRFSGELRVDGKKRDTFKNRKIGGKNVTPPCGPFEVEIRGWDRDRRGLKPISERLNMGIQDIRRTLDTYCGVSIYRDGFRVHPYGQKGNDWLNLDIRSRLTPGLKMANNQIVAAIRISRGENPKLSDRSPREGMVLNAEHAALEIWFKEILILLEDKRYDIRPRRKTDDRIEPLFEAFDVSPAVQQARKELGKDHPLAALIANTEKQVKEGVERVQEVFSRLLMSAGLGHMIDIVIHEIGAPLGKINRQLAVMEKQLTQLLDDRGWAKVEPMIQSIKSWLEQIHNLRQRLDPQTPAKRGRATSFDVKEEIADNFELHQALLEKQGISWRIVAPKKPVRVRMSRAALGQIIVNLIDNSIFWIVREKGIGNGGEILVRLKPVKTGFRIMFCDDGPGVDEADESKIFEPYFSKKPNGIGLGLYIARLVIEPYGKLVYRSDGKLSGACFEAVFERGVGG
ncbi:MAG: ATP-binding protein [Pirellulales bacterium]|nr:ATP-binding protein [Pirellulales bacterium]